MKNIVWNDVVDKKYRIEVERIDAHTGELHIFDSTNKGAIIIHREQVPLAYQAIFGPDISDISEWEDKCINFIDRYNGLN